MSSYGSNSMYRRLSSTVQPCLQYHYMATYNQCSQSQAALFPAPTRKDYVYTPPPVTQSPVRASPALQTLAQNSPSPTQKPLQTQSPISYSPVV